VLIYPLSRLAASDALTFEQIDEGLPASAVATEPFPLTPLAHRGRRNAKRSGGYLG
jgi:hypothetical protein